jgi:hypothetical protein
VIRECLCTVSFILYLFVVSCCRNIEAPTFDYLHDLEEQDFEQLGGGYVLEACCTYYSFLALRYTYMYAMLKHDAYYNVYHRYLPCYP